MAEPLQTTVATQTLPLYRYDPLPANHIRVLQLLPSHHQESPIKCKLISYPLLHNGYDTQNKKLVERQRTHLYEAVSYVWGPPPDTHELLIAQDKADNACLPIRQNCHAALARLRDLTLPRFLWVDAVCINQKDNDEKTVQVQLMTWIYYSARSVIVWLEEPTWRGDPTGKDRGEPTGSNQGETSGTTRGVPSGTGHQTVTKALQAIQDVAEGLIQKPDHQKAREGVNKLARRSWFRRVWVLQEVAAARHVTIVSQEGEIDGEVFCSGLETLGLRSTSGSSSDTQGSLASEAPDSGYKSDAWGLVRTAAVLIKGAALRRRQASGTLQSFTLNIMPLLELVRMYHDRAATDRRDKVFALFGMSSNIPDGIVPDYNVQWKHVFGRFTKTILDSNAFIETDDEHEIAVIGTEFHVLGTVSKVSQKNTLDNVQEVTILLIGGKRVAITGFTPSRVSHPGMGSGRALPLVKTTWNIYTPVVSIRLGDIVCLLRGTTQPTIIRPHHQHMYCVVVAMTIAPLGSTQHELTQQRLPGIQVPLLWDWSMSDQDIDHGNEHGIDPHKTLVYAEQTNTAWPLPKTLRSLAQEIRNWSRLAFQTGKAELATQLIDSFLSAVTGVDEKKTFQMLGVFDMFRDLYREVGLDFLQHHHSFETIIWLADQLRDKQTKAGYTEVPEALLFTTILYARYPSDGTLSLAQKLQTLSRYRGSDLRITTEVLRAAVMTHSPSITTWALERLDYQPQLPATVDVAEVMKAAAKARNYSAMAQLIAHFGEATLIVSIEVAKALWHPRTKEFWPSRPAGWGQVSWVPCNVGPLFDTWRSKIPLKEKQGVLEELAEDNGSMELMQAYLEEWKSDGQVVTATMIARVAGRYYEGAEGALKDLLLQYGYQVSAATEEMMMGAIENRYKAQLMVTVLLDYYKKQVPLTEKVLTAVAKADGKEGSAVLRLLLERYGVDRVRVTEEVMKAAAGSYSHGRQLVSMVLDEYGELAPLTGPVLGAAVKRGSSDTILLLLSETSKRGHTLKVDEETIRDAILGGRPYRSGVLLRILKIFAVQQADAGVGVMRGVMMEARHKKSWGSASVVDDLVESGFGDLVPASKGMLLDIRREAEDLDARRVELNVKFGDWDGRDSAGEHGEEYGVEMSMPKDERARAEKIEAWLVTKLTSGSVVDGEGQREDRDTQEEDWETDGDDRV